MATAILLLQDIATAFDTSSPSTAIDMTTTPMDLVIGYAIRVSQETLFEIFCHF